MQTQAGDPGAFADFDLGRVESPAFVIDAAKIRQNCQILSEIRDQSDAHVLLALKAFSMWSLAPMIGEYLDGVCTSGLWEARLASEFYDGEISTYSPASRTSWTRFAACPIMSFSIHPLSGIGQPSFLIQRAAWAAGSTSG
jgi:carboxynorspermidine decarboxylase